MRRLRSPEWKLYLTDRANARWRGVEWLLTYQEWLSIWEASGHFHEKGKRGGQYVMARFGFVGPVSADNVKIVAVNVQARCANLGNRSPASAKAKISAARQAYWTPERREAMSKRYQNRHFSETTRQKISESARLNASILRANRRISVDDKPKGLVRVRV